MVVLHAGEARPESTGRQQRIGDRIIYYTHQETENPGSGGNYYKLNAWEATVSGYISYQQERMEKGVTDFALCWHVIEGTSVQLQ